jgi:hypothetical protein
MSFWSDSITFINRLQKKLLELLKKQRRIVMICCCVLGALLLFLAVFLWAQRVRRPPSAEPDSGQIMTYVSEHSDIRPEELFLPEEPDFLPEFIPDREPGPWTAEDARSFWTVPSKDAELWRRKIETVIDELLEQIP